MTNGDTRNDAGFLTRRSALRLSVLALSTTALTPMFGAHSAVAATVAPQGSALVVAAQGGEPKAGGVLTVAFVGGGAAETLDPNAFSATIDIHRGLSIWERLTSVAPDFSLRMELAESFTPNAAHDEWTVKLKPGVLFHDGSKLTVDDLIFTLKRVVAKDSSNPGNATISSVIDFARVARIDDLSVKFGLKRPFVPFAEIFSDYWMVVLKDGTADFSHPVGTGPFKYKEFSPGNGSRFVKNTDYRRKGLPHLDELVFVSVPSGDARLSALKSGQVQAVEGISFTQARQNRNARDVVVLEGRGPVFTPFVMSLTQAPFDDVRVRRAFRLIVDREALVGSALAGFGEVGNDLYGKGLRYYADGIPQRGKDLVEARRLLKEAGHEKLTVSLSTASLWPAQIESAQIFAQQAAKAGVTVTLDVQPADQYFANAYGKVPFFQSSWQSQPIPTWMETALVPGGLFNETKQDDPTFTAKLHAAQGEADPVKAQAAWKELQEIFHDNSGYIIWGFLPYLDGLAPNVRGAVGSGWNQLAAATYQDWWLG